MERKGCLPCAEKPVIGFILSRFFGVPFFSTRSLSSVLIVSCCLRLYFSSSLSRRSFEIFVPLPLRATRPADLILGRYADQISYCNSILNTWADIVVTVLVLSRKLHEMINVVGNKLHWDLRLPPVCVWGLHSSPTFRGVPWYVNGRFGTTSGLHLQLSSTPRTDLVGPLGPWRWDRYVVPKRRTVSQKSQDLKRRQVVPKLRTGWITIRACICQLRAGIAQSV